MGNTIVDLPRDLIQPHKESADKPARQLKIKTIIEKAKRGVYHDFKSDLATPKMQLHFDLLDADLVEIDQKMQAGDYDDEPPTEEESRELMEALAKDIGK